MDRHRDMTDVSRVAPFTGAWIEIERIGDHHACQQVAPFTGAWIEIRNASACSLLMVSLPSRERGLKSCLPHPAGSCPRVAPFTGAWIEISLAR